MGLFLHDTSYDIEGTLSVSKSISLTSNKQIVVDLKSANGPVEFRFSFGYACWGKGQVEREIENGDWFVIYCGTSMAGLRQYLGEAIDIPVMGYDGHHSTAGYCENGDTPQFKLFKSIISEMIDLYS